MTDTATATATDKPRREKGTSENARAKDIVREIHGNDKLMNQIEKGNPQLAEWIRELVAVLPLTGTGATPEDKIAAAEARIDTIFAEEVELKNNRPAPTDEQLAEVATLSNRIKRWKNQLENEGDETAGD